MRGEMVLADVAGQGDGIEPTGANGGVGQQGIDMEGAFRPPFGQEIVLQHGHHQAGVAHALDRYGLDRARNDGGRRHGAAGAEGRAGERFDRPADGDVAQRRGRRVDARIGPSAGGRNSGGDGFGVTQMAGQGIREPLFRFRWSWYRASTSATTPAPSSPTAKAWPPPR